MQVEGEQVSKTTGESSGLRSGLREDSDLGMVGSDEGQGAEKEEFKEFEKSYGKEQILTHPNFLSFNISGKSTKKNSAWLEQKTEKISHI